MDDRKDLEILLAGHFPLITIASFEEPRAVEMITSIANRRSWSLSRWSVTDGLVPITGDALFNADDLRLEGQAAVPDATRSTRDAEAALRVIRNARQAGIVLLLDFHPFLDEPVNVRLIKEIAHNHDLRQQKLVFISHDIQLPPELSRQAASFSLALPGYTELARVVAEEAEVWALRRPRERIRADKATVSALVKNLGGLTRTDARRLVRNAIHDDGAITASDVAGVAEAKHALIGQDGLLAFEFDTAKLADVGGLNRLKQWLALREAAFKQGTAADDKPRGILLVGVQGGGKSLAAKAVAGVWQVPLLRLDFGVLYNKFFGETESNLRKALASAELLSPCVLWCDEIEKGIATGDYDSGTSKRVLGTLLTWMAENARPVFIVATANDISALPPELMRKGRLDEIFFVDLPSAAVRADIFAIHLGKRGLEAAAFDLARLAAACEGYTGAEIEQAVVSACYAARARECAVDTALVESELLATRPLSTLMAEQMTRLRAWAGERCVPAD